MNSNRHTERLIKLFQRLPFSLRQEEEHEEEPDDIPTCVE